MKSPSDIVAREINTDFFHRFSIGDTIELKFSRCVLTAQHIKFEGSSEVLNLLSEHFPPALEVIDPEDVAIALGVSSCQRAEVVSTYLADSGELSLAFSSGLILIFPIDTPEVDWHWALQRCDGDPFSEFIVGAFENGQVKIEPCEQDGESDS